METQPLAIRIEVLRPAIADAYARGYTIIELAKHFSMDRKTIRKVLVKAKVKIRGPGRRQAKHVPPSPLEI